MSVSRALGSDFVLKLENNSTDSPLANKVRSLLLENPNMHIIGAKIESDTELPDIVDKLNLQMGLPLNSSLRAVGDRLAGREKDFILVLNGFNNLSSNAQGGIERTLRRLKVKILTDST